LWRCSIRRRERYRSELVAAYRRHADIGLTRQPSDIVDRLTDHFLRVVDRTSVTWVHPSWRDLVIEELIEDPADRQKFLRASSIEGVLLAISIAGGSAGERVLRPAAPALAPTWIELLPTDRIDVSSQSDLARLDDWTALAEVLSRHALEALTAFEFPDQQRRVISAFVDDVRRLSPAHEPLARRELLVRILWRLDALAPKYAEPAGVVAVGLASVREEPELPDTYTPRPISAELRRILAPTIPQRSDEAVVARVLRDL
jgi:hypothetical protein